MLIYTGMKWRSSSKGWTGTLTEGWALRSSWVSWQKTKRESSDGKLFEIRRGDHAGETFQKHGQKQWRSSFQAGYLFKPYTKSIFINRVVRFSKNCIVARSIIREKRGISGVSENKIILMFRNSWQFVPTSLMTKSKWRLANSIQAEMISWTTESSVKWLNRR